MGVHMACMTSGGSVSKRIIVVVVAVRVVFARVSVLVGGRVREERTAEGVDYKLRVESVSPRDSRVCVCLALSLSFRPLVSPLVSIVFARSAH